MFSSVLFRRLFLPYLMLIVGATAAVGILGARRLRESYLESRRQGLRDDARLISETIAPLLAEPATREAMAVDAAPLEAAASANLQKRAGQLGETLKCRVTIIRADGKVLADNEADPAGMELHDQRPEIVEARDHGDGAAVRRSATLNVDLLYVAHRAIIRGQTCYVRLAVPLGDLNESLRVLYWGLIASGGAAIAGSGLIAFFVARRSTRPMVELTRFADDLSKADLSKVQFQPSGLTEDWGEVGTLSTALNKMARSLSGMIAQINKDRAELLTILASMSEGVIATDNEQRILLVNEAAGTLLGFEPSAAIGKWLYEVVLNDKILKSAAEAQRAAERRQFQVGPVQARHLEVTITTFPSSGPAEGLIVVTHDTTQSVRYQELRKEFVANVSHELRTPLTVIKGFVETLQDGALADPERAARYLGTIERHTNQLTNLVNDLLEISKLESQPDVPRRSSVDLGQTLRRAVELLTPAAQARQQTLVVQAPAHLPHVVGNTDYLDRAINNLIDNAIKYTPEGGRVSASARFEDDQVIVEVSDNGLGIPEEDLPRIFERFYRVDRSRSREMGGTGLGLSIVKHIAQSHGGSIDVTSTVGEGSTFRLSFPAKPTL